MIGGNLACVACPLQMSSRLGGQDYSLNGVGAKARRGLAGGITNRVRGVGLRVVEQPYSCASSSKECLFGVGRLNRMST